jgi:hypothetical protein
VIGLSGQEVMARLGRPNWTRRERPAEVWQYEAGACTLDLYLYQDHGTDRVIHAEARDRAAASVPLAGCLALIGARQPVRPAS